MIPIAKPWLDDAEIEAVAAVLRSGWVAQGRAVAQFEARLAELIGVEHVVAVSNGTAALHLAMIGAGVGPGDDVVVPSASFIATANCVRYVGARPVFADVCPVTQNLTVDTILAAWTPATRAVIVVDQLGVPVDIAPIEALCVARGATLVDDAACALGSRYRGHLVGRDAPIATFSFHPRKVITTGEGGAVVCRDGALAARLRRLRQHGVDLDAAARHGAAGTVVESYAELGYNYRMTDLHAAIGNVQLERLDTIVAQRRVLADQYHALLHTRADLLLPRDPSWGEGNIQSYCVKLIGASATSARRDAILERLAGLGVGARPGVASIHRLGAYRDQPHGPLPETERWADTSFLLPLYPQLEPAEVEHTAASLVTTLDALN